jgi:hypothetical protein
MLAAAMTNSGAINTSGATTMQNPQRAPGWKQANRAAAQRRYAAGLTPTQMQAIQQYNAAKQQRQQAAPIQMQAAPSSQPMMRTAFDPGMAAQQAQLGYAAPSSQPMMRTAFDPGMAAQQAQLGYAAPSSQGMTMGGGGFNERGSASTPIGMHLLQLQAPYASQPMAYGGGAVPASAYMF